MSIKRLIFIVFLFHSLTSSSQETSLNRADEVYQHCLKENEASSCTSGCGMIIQACKEVRAAFLNETKHDVGKQKFCDDVKQLRIESYPEIYNAYKSQLIYSEIYSACKVMPHDATRAILVFSPPSVSKSNSEVQNFDVIILIVSVSNSKVLNKYIEKNAIKSDALEYQAISVDTANYMVTPNNRAFGIRVSHRAGNHYSEDALSLYSERNDKIIKLLSGLIVNYSRSDINQDCDATNTDSASTLVINPVKSRGFYNLNVKTKESIRIETPLTDIKNQDSQKCNSKATLTNRNYKLTFNGADYSVPKPLKSTMWH